jgi:hypothetical protein
MIGTNIEAHIGTLATRRIMRGGERAYVSGDVGRGQDEICPVCFWEDDGLDEHDADEVRGGPNYTLSLTEARTNFRNSEACEARFLTKVRRPLPDERENW